MIFLWVCGIVIIFFSTFTFFSLIAQWREGKLLFPYWRCLRFHWTGWRSLADATFSFNLVVRAARFEVFPTSTTTSPDLVAPQPQPRPTSPPRTLQQRATSRRSVINDLERGQLPFDSMRSEGVPRGISTDPFGPTIVIAPRASPALPATTNPHLPPPIPPAEPPFPAPLPSSPIREAGEVEPPSQIRTNRPVSVSVTDVQPTSASSPTPLSPSPRLGSTADRGAPKCRGGRLPSPPSLSVDHSDSESTSVHSSPLAHRTSPLPSFHSPFDHNPSAITSSSAGGGAVGPSGPDNRSSIQDGRKSRQGMSRRSVRAGMIVPLVFRQSAAPLSQVPCPSDFPAPRPPASPSSSSLPPSVSHSQPPSFSPQLPQHLDVDSDVHAQTMSSPSLTQPTAPPTRTKPPVRPTRTSVPALDVGVTDNLEGFGGRAGPHTKPINIVKFPSSPPPTPSGNGRMLGGARSRASSASSSLAKRANRVPSVSVAFVGTGAGIGGPHSASSTSVGSGSGRYKDFVLELPEMAEEPSPRFPSVLSPGPAPYRTSSDPSANVKTSPAEKPAASASTTYLLPPQASPHAASEALPPHPSPSNVAPSQPPSPQQPKSRVRALLGRMLRSASSNASIFSSLSLSGSGSPSAMSPATPAPTPTRTRPEGIPAPQSTTTAPTGTPAAVPHARTISSPGPLLRAPSKERGNGGRESSVGSTTGRGRSSTLSHSPANSNPNSRTGTPIGTIMGASSSSLNLQLRRSRSIAGGSGRPTLGAGLVKSAAPSAFSSRKLSPSASSSSVSTSTGTPARVPKVPVPPSTSGTTKTKGSKGSASMVMTTSTSASTTPSANAAPSGKSSIDFPGESSSTMSSTIDPANYPLPPLLPAHFSQSPQSPTSLSSWGDHGIEFGLSTRTSEESGPVMERIGGSDLRLKIIGLQQQQQRPPHSGSGSGARALLKSPSDDFLAGLGDDPFASTPSTPLIVDNPSAGGIRPPSILWGPPSTTSLVAPGEDKTTKVEPRIGEWYITLRRHPNSD
ncbi:hypothetical protein DL93DRAFT_1624309 [Clavulina sp. PMI_390]|nr:hypothetical protein DL93DRAFT_1624309 [Clavulina sp. PMI_390]